MQVLHRARTKVEARLLRHTCASKPARQLWAVICQPACRCYRDFLNWELATANRSAQSLSPAKLPRAGLRNAAYKSPSCPARAAPTTKKQLTTREEATANPRASAADEKTARATTTATAPAPCRGRGRGRGRATANQEAETGMTTAAASRATRRSSPTRSPSSAAWRAPPSSSGV